MNNMDKLDWTTLRTQLLYELLFVPRTERGDSSRIEDNITQRFMDEVENRLDVGFEAICHCLYTVAEELMNEDIK